MDVHSKEVTVTEPQGGTCSIHDGEVRRIFWVENLHPLYFLGQGICNDFLGLKVRLTE